MRIDPNKIDGYSMQDLFAQIEYCGYETIAGALTNNIAYIELKRRINKLGHLAAQLACET